LTRAHLLTAISIGSSITLDNPMVENALAVSTDLVGCNPRTPAFRDTCKSLT